MSSNDNFNQWALLKEAMDYANKAIKFLMMESFIPQNDDPQIPEELRNIFNKLARDANGIGPEFTLLENRPKMVIHYIFPTLSTQDKRLLEWLVHSVMLVRLSDGKPVEKVVRSLYYSLRADAEKLEPKLLPLQMAILETDMFFIPPPPPCDNPPAVS